MDAGSLTGVKRPMRGADHPLRSGAEAVNEWNYTSESSSVPLRHVTRVHFTLYRLAYCLKVFDFDIPENVCSIN